MADMNRSWSKDSAANSIDSDASDNEQAQQQHALAPKAENGEQVVDLAKSVRVRMEKAQEAREEAEEEAEEEDNEATGEGEEEETVGHEGE